MDQERLKKFLEQHCEYVENVEASADRVTHRNNIPQHPIVIIRLLPHATQCARCDRAVPAAPKFSVALCEGGRRVHCSVCRRWVENLGDQPGSRLPRQRGRPAKQRTEPDKPKRPPGRPRKQLPQSLPVASQPGDVLAVVRDYPECRITEFLHPEVADERQRTEFPVQNTAQHKY